MYTGDIYNINAICSTSLWRTLPIYKVRSSGAGRTPSQMSCISTQWWAGDVA